MNSFFFFATINIDGRESNTSQQKKKTTISKSHNYNKTSGYNIKTALIKRERESYGVSRHFQQYFSYIVAVSFIGGGNLSTRRKPPTCRKSLTNFYHIMLYQVYPAWAGFELTT